MLRTLLYALESWARVYAKVFSATFWMIWLRNRNNGQWNFSLSQNLYQNFFYRIWKNMGCKSPFWILLLLFFDWQWQLSQIFLPQFCNISGCTNIFNNRRNNHKLCTYCKLHLICIFNNKLICFKCSWKSHSIVSRIIKKNCFVFVDLFCLWHSYNILLVLIGSFLKNTLDDFGQIQTWISALYCRDYNTTKHLLGLPGSNIMGMCIIIRPICHGYQKDLLHQKW